MTVPVRLVVNTEKFEALLAKRKMTRKELADRTGLSKTYINYLANGERNPRRTNAELIAAVLKVPTGRFITEQWVARPPRAPRHNCPVPVTTPEPGPSIQESR